MQENLFDLASGNRTAPQEKPISEDQVSQLRAAFEAAGVSAMEDRRELIESCTIRPVASIRELLARDVRPILQRIQARTTTLPAGRGSAWDNREEDTWIDRL